MKKRWLYDYDTLFFIFDVDNHFEGEDGGN